MAQSVCGVRSAPNASLVRTGGWSGALIISTAGARSRLMVSGDRTPFISNPSHRLCSATGALKLKHSPSTFRPKTYEKSPVHSASPILPGYPAPEVSRGQSATKPHTAFPTILSTAQTKQRNFIVLPVCWHSPSFYGRIISPQTTVFMLPATSTWAWIVPSYPTHHSSLAGYDPLIELSHFLFHVCTICPASL